MVESFGTGQFSVPLHAGREQLAFTLRDLGGWAWCRHGLRGRSLRPRQSRGSRSLTG